MLRVLVQAAVDLPQTTVMGQWQHQVDLRRGGQLIQHHLGQPTLGAILDVLHRQLAETANQLAQQAADGQHLTTLGGPGGDTAIQIQTAHFGMGRTEHPVWHPGRNPYRPLRRRDETSDTGLDLQYPGDGVGQLHPRMTVTTGQGTVGQ